MLGAEPVRPERLVEYFVSVGLHTPLMPLQRETGRTTKHCDQRSTRPARCAPAAAAAAAPCDPKIPLDRSTGSLPCAGLSLPRAEKPITDVCVVYGKQDAPEGFEKLEFSGQCGDSQRGAQAGLAPAARELVESF